MATKSSAPMLTGEARVSKTLEFVVASLPEIDDMLEFNKRFVKILNNRMRRRRAEASAQLDDGDYVKFTSRKSGKEVALRVEKITPAGVVYGYAPTGERWKVSASVCTKIDGAHFTAVGMAQSVLRNPVTSKHKSVLGR